MDRVFWREGVRYFVTNTGGRVSVYWLTDEQAEDFRGAGYGVEPVNEWTMPPTIQAPAEGERDG